MEARGRQIKQVLSKPDLVDNYLPFGCARWLEDVQIAWWVEAVPGGDCPSCLGVILPEDKQIYEALLLLGLSTSTGPGQSLETSCHLGWSMGVGLQS